MGYWSSVDNTLTFVTRVNLNPRGVQVWNMGLTLLLLGSGKQTHSNALFLSFSAG